MGLKLIQETTLTDIADALRTVNNSTAKIDPANFASMILQLSSPRPEMLEMIETATTERSLDSLSWKQIDKLSTGLARGTITYSDASGLLGLSKSFTYDSNTCYAFIIGILQDQWSGSPRGFTF